MPSCSPTSGPPPTATTRSARPTPTSSRCNGWFKALCTEWQLHDHPRSCVQRLGERHREVDAIGHRLAGAITRFSPYPSRFDTALIRLRAGDANAFTKPLTGSYHDVWMHLHEDLLLTLDRPRSDLDEA